MWKQIKSWFAKNKRFCKIQEIGVVIMKEMVYKNYM